jgi:hypothetical protein
MKVVKLSKYKANKYAENFNQDAFVEDLKILFKKYNLKEIKTSSESEIGFKDDGIFCLSDCVFWTTDFIKK